jgi:ATP-dependent DNA ligase
LGPLRPIVLTGMSALPFAPPLAPMLARLARELPAGDYAYEPKWDGFRCLAFAEPGRVEQLDATAGDPAARGDRP